MREAPPMPIPHIVGATGSPVIHLSIECPGCRSISTLDVDEEALGSWLLRGVFLQDAFPTLSDDDRERLKTGLCPACWDKMFGEQGPDWERALDPDAQ